MENRARAFMLNVVLGFVVLGSYMPGVYARGSSSYGPAVDAACQGFNGTTPFADQGCALCHNTSSLGQRVEPAWSWFENGQLTNFCPQQPNQPPNGMIDSPAGNPTINTGESIRFAGTGSDPDGDTPLSYQWNFGGGAPDSNLHNPGSVTFDIAGTYPVTFTVTDSQGLSDPTPDTRIVTVIEISTCTDDDGDGYSAVDAVNCSPVDCNDSNAAINPGALENCNDGIDNNCNGLIDSADPAASGCPGGGACLDNDNDDYSPEGGICGPVDCDDFAPAVNPGVPETCGDGIDNDCDGAVDDEDPQCNGSDCIAALLGGDGDGTAGTVNITRAEWNSRRDQLTVAGDGAPAGEVVTVMDASGTMLGTATVRKNGVWNVRARLQPGDAPCRIVVGIAGESAETDVANAPADCGSGGGGAGVTITQAEWQERRNRLTVEGAQGAAGAVVTVRNATSGSILGTTTVRSDGTWKFTARMQSGAVPCSIRAEIYDDFAELIVTNAPEGCGYDDDTGSDDDSEPGSDDDVTDSGDSHDTDSPYDSTEPEYEEDD